MLSLKSNSIPIWFELGGLFKKKNNKTDFVTSILQIINLIYWFWWNTKVRYNRILHNDFILNESLKVLNLHFWNSSPIFFTHPMMPLSSTSRYFLPVRWTTILLKTFLFFKNCKAAFYCNSIQLTLINNKCVTQAGGWRRWGGAQKRAQTLSSWQLSFLIRSESLSAKKKNQRWSANITTETKQRLEKCSIWQMLLSSTSFSLTFATCTVYSVMKNICLHFTKLNLHLPYLKHLDDRDMWSK